jgi:hypothetical protein
LTTTGHPAASAAAVSPPAVEKASGKFDAANTATGADRPLHHPELRPGQRLAVGQRLVVPPIEVVAGADVAREEPELAGRPAAFAFEPDGEQTGLGRADRGDRLRPRLDLVGDPLEEGRPLLAGGIAVAPERLLRRLRGALDMVGRADGKAMRLAGRRLGAECRLAGPRSGAFRGGEHGQRPFSLRHAFSASATQSSVAG